MFPWFSARSRPVEQCLGGGLGRTGFAPLIRHTAMLSTTANPTDGLDSTALLLWRRTRLPSPEFERGATSR